MSIDSANKFLDLLHTDATLRNEVHSVAEGIVAVANAHGYDVTREEIADALKQHWKDDIDPTECVVKFSEAPGFDLV
jgi:predicted ribosomally synthesized peptide with nif11-like leader